MSSSATTAAKKRRSGNIVASPLFKSGTSSGNNEPVQRRVNRTTENLQNETIQQLNTEQPVPDFKKPMPLQQVITLFDKRLLTLEKAIIENANTNGTCASINNELNVEHTEKLMDSFREDINVTLTEQSNEFDYRTNILANEITSLKEIYEKSASTNNEVNSEDTEYTIKSFKEVLNVTLTEQSKEFDDRTSILENNNKLNSEATESMIKSFKDDLKVTLTEQSNECDHRIMGLTNEITVLKDIILKLQSYTMEVNKTLLEERVFIYSEHENNIKIEADDVKQELSDYTENIEEDLEVQLQEEPVQEEQVQLQEEPVHEEPVHEEPVHEEQVQLQEEPVHEEQVQLQEEPVLEEQVQLQEEPVHEEQIQLQEEPVHEEQIQLQEEPVHEEQIQLQEEPVHEEPVQEEPVQEEPVQEEQIQLQEEPVQEEQIQLQEEQVQEEEPVQVAEEKPVADGKKKSKRKNKEKKSLSVNI